MTDILETKVLKGGEYLIAETPTGETFAPEDFSEEQLMVRDTVRDFVVNRIFPNREKIDKGRQDIVVELLDEMAGMGLLGAGVPEEYGGMLMDFNTNTLISDVYGPSGAITVSYAVQVGIGLLPILYFGTDAQKLAYLPKICSGEIKSCYCLTEPGSGSDALAAKTRADLTDDGKHYLITGQKMWISNSGFADLFIVFAKIGGEKFSCFLVDGKSEGLTLGAEEEKLGIKGSSTRQVFFENVKIPTENLLGTAGKGHLIAFNVLNIGRFKLGAMTMGGCREVVSVATRYANERIQFKQPISHFGAIQYKIAQMALLTFAGEATSYRISDMIQQKIATNREAGMSYADAQLEAAEEYAIECSILKIVGSEYTDYCVDENIQIHGGVGYSEEFSAARAYRDSRINRIYEGTNEINRLLMVDMLLRRAMKGELDIISPAWAVQKELSSMPSFEQATGLYGAERAALRDFKKIILMTAGAAAKMQIDGKLNMKEEQEVLMNIADLMIDTFVAESLLLRIEKVNERTEKAQPQDVYDSMLHLFFTDATSRISKNATDALCSFAEGDLLKTFLMGLKRYTKYAPVNVKHERRNIAGAVIAANGWCFQK